MALLEGPGAREAWLRDATAFLPDNNPKQSDIIVTFDMCGHENAKMKSVCIPIQESS
jgi:hypothetical protein